MPFQLPTAKSVGYGLLLAIPIIIAAEIFGSFVNTIAQNLGLW